MSSLSKDDAPASGQTTEERRQASDRRKQPFRALLYGSFRRRRRGPRRDGEYTLGSVDWHDPRFLAVAVLIVIMSCADAFLTLTLIQNGASEVNPLMAPLVGGSAAMFAGVKIGLTIVGVVLLTIMARLRAFGRIPVSYVLYLVLAGYVALVAYEWRLLLQTPVVL